MEVSAKVFATSIVQSLRQRGFQAYLVGGCVRDLLLKR
jgi:tRNA nucleotidyltransferase/poly(A) polymerase